MACASARKLDLARALGFLAYEWEFQNLLSVVENTRWEEAPREQ